MAAHSVYTDELGQKIFDRIASTTIAVKHICAELDLNYSTVRSWIADSKHPMSDLYARAKQLQMEHMAEEMIDIADDGSNDLMTIVKGDESYEQENKEIVNRAKIRIDTRKWLMSKLNPKKYGDKLDLTSDNKALAPTNITIVRDGGN